MAEPSTPEDRTAHLGEDHRTVDDFPRQGGPLVDAPVRQFGLVESALSRQRLIGALDVPMSTLADRLGLTVERSFNEHQGGDAAYFEAAEDGFTLIHWDPAEHVDVYAYIARHDSAHTGGEELMRFLA